MRDVVKLAAHESRDNGHFVDSLLLFLRVHRIDVVLEILCSQLVRCCWSVVIVIVGLVLTFPLCLLEHTHTQSAVLRPQAGGPASNQRHMWRAYATEVMKLVA